MIQNWKINNKNYNKESKKNYTVSEFFEVNELSERYLIQYQIEERNKDEQSAFITQCHIYKYCAN